MGDKSKIEWTDASWNPTTGCTKVSQGCKNCYAERVFPRAYGKDREFTDIHMHADRLDLPLHWARPRRVFVNSMSDLFHEKVPFSFVDAVMATMLGARQHTYQILTKRPARMREYFSGVREWTITREHIWLGVSVEDQATADERIPLLLQTPAAVRFVSYEPALGPVDFTNWLGEDHDSYAMIDGLNWLIAGGESGPKARPADIAWFRSARDQCRAANVAFFMKQLGANAGTLLRAGGGTWERFMTKDRAGADPTEWPDDLRVRKFPL